MKKKRYFKIWDRVMKNYTALFSFFMLIGIAMVMSFAFADSRKGVFASLFLIFILMVYYFYVLIHFCNIFYSIKVSDKYIYSTSKHFYVVYFQVLYASYTISYKEAEKFRVSIKDIQKIEFIFEPIDYKGRELLGNYKFELLYRFDVQKRGRQMSHPKDFFGMFVDIPRPFLKITDNNGKKYLFSICYFKTSQVKDMLENLILRMKEVNNLNYMDVDTVNFIEEYKKAEEFYKISKGNYKE